MAATSFSYAETSTWEYTWEKTKANGGEGFYNFGSTYVDADTLSTSINGLTWSITSEGTKKYAMTATGGQTIGTTATDNSVHTSLFTYEVPGKVTAVRVQARRHEKSAEGHIALSVNGVRYSVEDPNLSASLQEFVFTPSAEAQEGKFDLELFQTGETKNILYLKSLSIDYETAAVVVNAPVLSLAAGTYDEEQKCAISVEGYEAGTYTIYYTTDGTSPKSTDGSRQIYTAPVAVTENMKIRAVTCVDGQYSGVVEASYVVREDPRLSFAKDTMYIEYPDDDYGQALINPLYVSPIAYSSSQPDVCIVDKYGSLRTVRTGETRITATFAGNDQYKPSSASYLLIVKAKIPLNKPVITPMGGTFDEFVEVNISVDDERAKTIWYSTVASDSAALTEDPEIIPATSGSITIRKSCKLLVLAAGYNVFSPLVEAEYVINEKTRAQFVADEANSVYYQQGFDSLEEIKDWQLYSYSRTTFRLEPEPTLKPYTSFKTIDPASEYSLNIQYTDSEQDEIFESQVMTIRPNSTLEFYSFFSGIWLWYANWTVNVYDVEKDQSATLVNGFDWAQDNAFTGPAWIRFTSDLSEYAGRKVQFYIRYRGAGGEDVAFDGFKLLEQDTSEEARITINECDSIHFHDRSTGADTLYWSFPGGQMLNDDYHHPVVAYEEAGIYDVQLIIVKGEETDTLVRKGFVEVKAEMPKAIIGLPAEGYLSPFRGVFIPVGVPVTFHDLSTGRLTERNWVFQATDITSSTEADPVVTFLKAGTFSVGLQVGNSVGSDQDVLAYAIQAGGAQYIWNISPDENQDLSKVELGFYGNYAGSNWLDVYSFAESFAAPLAPATIDSVAVYFASTETVTPDTAIVVAIHAVDSLGMPGRVLASGSVKAGDLAWDDKVIVPTIFHLDHTVTVDSTAFFVSVSGMPCNLNEAYEADDIAILCHLRSEGQKNTSYQYVAEYDEDNHMTGECRWYENTDNPLSMAVSPVLDYGIPTSISTLESESSQIKVRKVLRENRMLLECGDIQYDMMGIRVK